MKHKNNKFNKKKIIVGTRNSSLAITQTKQVIEQLKSKNSNVEFTLKIIKSDGDIQSNKNFKDFSTTGIFVKKLQDSLLKKNIDIAIHSLKDVPTENNKNLVLSCFPKRKNPEDILLFSNLKIKLKFQFYNFLNLLNIKKKYSNKKIIIGTSSERRKYQIFKNYPFCEVKKLRGNIDTRIQKMKDNHYDGIILAKAGLDRLFINNKNYFQFKKLHKTNFVPAPAQGCLTIETRKEKKTIEIVSIINDKKTEEIVTIERKIMKKLEAGCQTPLGCYVKKYKKYYFIYLFYYKNQSVYKKEKVLKKNIDSFIKNLTY